MKKLIKFCFLLVTVLFITSNIYSQEINFMPQTICDEALSATSVYAVDVDGDGDIDVLSSSQGDDKIAWYQNNGDENFTYHIITTSAGNAMSVYAIDVDSDGDMDVLSASWDDDKIAWYENDGNENFSSHTITSNALGAWSVFAVDIDEDGDMDVLSANSGFGVAWYENDGDENFTFCTIGLGNCHTVHAADVDGDGDIDVLSASYDDNRIDWYENDGNENFTFHTVFAYIAQGAISVYAVDVDGDGDMDVLSASELNDRVYWYENNGEENFLPLNITSSADRVRSVYAEDVDGDGDMDVLSASMDDDKIAWYENDGNENFSTHTISTSADGANSVYAVDMDGDGDMDVFSASQFDNKIAWYENLQYNTLISVNNIQYTTDPGADGTYPSLMVGETVETSGIVTAVGYAGFDNSFFISTPENEPWEGVLVFLADIEPEIGDSIVVFGEVVEYFGLTEIHNSNIIVLSSGNPVPDPIVVNTGDLVAPVDAEAYEGCLVKVENVTVTQEPNSYNEWYIDDGTGECQVDDKIFAYPASLGEQFTYIVGAIDYGYDEYGINPRNMDDLYVYSIDDPPNNSQILYQNSPNPFNTYTSIMYSLPQSSIVKMNIYNLKGHLVKTLVSEEKQAGNHTVDWLAENMRNGIYFCKMVTKNITSVRKMILMK